MARKNNEQKPLPAHTKFNFLNHPNYQTHQRAPNKLLLSRSNIVFYSKMAPIGLVLIFLLSQHIFAEKPLYIVVYE
jgi:hypothetical protein